MSEEKFKYDFHEAYKALEKAQEAESKRTSDLPIPPSLPSTTERVLHRRVGRDELPVVVDPKYEPHHNGFCLACRGLMVCAGKPCKIMNNADIVTDEFYLHLPRSILEKTSAHGCSLCRVILSELRQRVPDSDIGDPSEDHVVYDFGSYLGGRNNEGEDSKNEKTYFIVFYEYLEDQRIDVVLNLHNMGDSTNITIGPTFRLNTTAESAQPASIWTNICNREHSCAPLGYGTHTPRKGSRFKPNRLIDVGKDDEGIHLVHDTDVPDDGQYATLSHCWGEFSGHQKFSLTAARLPDYQQGIPAPQLPRTFLDAIHFTRGLGLGYVWIDSLCIIQDSSEDWSEQSTQMWLIYGNSYLNISATASSDPSEGLFRDRPEKTLEPAIIYISPDHPELPQGAYRLYSETQWTRCVDQGPVNSRAWVLQERLLAPRTLHFCETEIFWECECFRGSEAFPTGLLPRVEVGTPITIKTQVTADTQGHVSHYGLLKTWDAVVKRYASLKLTFQSDKLIALSALAQQMSHVYPSGGRYLAGLWEAPLLSQLLWKSASPSRAKRVPDSRVPTWSWASVDGPIHPDFDFDGYEPYGRKSVSRPMLRVIEATTDAQPAQPYGAVGSGHLKVLGCLLKVSFGTTAPAPPREPRSLIKMREDMAKTAAHVIPGYTPDNIKLASNSMVGSSWESIMGTDAANGILFVDGSDTHFEDYRPRLIAGELKLGVDLDTDSDTTVLTTSDLFILPVSCVSANDRYANSESHSIHELGCLVLVEAKNGPAGTFQRVGVCRTDSDTTVAQLLCSLANQDGQGIQNGDLSSGEELQLGDFTPETWPCKELGFMPQKFPMLNITIV